MREREGDVSERQLSPSRIRWPWQIEYRATMRDRLSDAVMFTQAHLLSRLVDIKGSSSNLAELEAIRDALVQLRILQQDTNGSKPRT